MNPNPPFQGRGFGFGPGFVHAHDQMANTPLQWATFALVLLIILTLGALIVARVSGGPRHRRHIMKMRGLGGPDPTDVLRMRFASGQISREEYVQAVSDLTADAPTRPQPPAPEGP